MQSQTRASVFRHYALLETAEPYITGVAVGQAIAAGPVARLESPNEMTRFRPGDVLVTKRTDPDWGPIMKQAAAIITDEGGRTSHAAIVSRELGVPAVVGTQSGSVLFVTNTSPGRKRVISFGLSSRATGPAAIAWPTATPVMYGSAVSKRA
ncbi:MAG: PEP-utilizing enzyme [Myxococcota bacterium]